MSNTLTSTEANTVQRLIKLGDSEELAIKTVINNRPRQVMLQEQLENFHIVNN